jgi:hypothetical protein
VAQSCVANQQSTQVRKYVTGSDSLLSDSSNTVGRELQGALADAKGNPQRLDASAVKEASDRSETLYKRALENEEVPQEFQDAHHYLESALGIRYRATERLAGAASGSKADLREALAASVEDYRVSDSIVANHFIPASEQALDTAGQRGDRALLGEAEPFMDYDEAGFQEEAQGGAPQPRNDPNALHGVEITSVQVAGQPLYPGGNVVLTGNDEPVFVVTITNGGETPETSVPVEVILNTSAERQSRKATIERIEPNGGTATVEIDGFGPGQVNEAAEVTVEAGPVEYEEYLENNTLQGIVTFGL